MRRFASTALLEVYHRYLRLVSSRSGRNGPRWFVGTHHKSGTIWIRDVFRDIAAVSKIPFINISRHFYSKEGAIAISGRYCRQGRPFVFFEDHSIFPSCLIEDGTARGMHVVRDPRDMLLSGMKYHDHAEEAWLRVPMANLGGRTLQQFFRQASSEQARAFAEMEWVLDRTVKEMSDVACQEGVATFQYERLIGEDWRRAWTSVLEYFEVPGGEMPRLLQVVERNSVFGERAVQKKGHVHNPAPEKWRRELSPNLVDLVEERYSNSLAVLGYSLSGTLQ